MNPAPDTATLNDMQLRRSLEVKYRFWWSVVLRLLMLGGGVYVLWRVRTIFTTLVVALVLSCAAEPLVEWILRRLGPIRKLNPHLAKAIAAGIAYVVILGAIVAAIYYLFTPFQVEFGRLMKNLPNYQITLQHQFEDLQVKYPDLRARLEKSVAGLSLPNPSAYIAGVLGKVVLWGSHIVEAILIPVLAFYFTLDGKRLRNQFMFLVPRPRRRQTLAIIEDSRYIMRAYIVSQFWLASIAGILVWAFLRFYIGMDYAVVLGLFAGITRAIPVIGPLLGGIPLTLLTFVYGAQHDNPYLWVSALTFFTVMHLVESKVVTPLFLGHALNLHAVVIIVVLLIGGEFFGLMGMFLAAPVAALLRILLDYYVIRPRERRLGVAMPPGSKRKGRTLRLERALNAARRPLPVPGTVGTVATASGPALSTIPSKD